MLLRLYRALMPRDEQFVQHFQAHAGHIVAAAEALREIFAGTADFERAFQTIRERERRSDSPGVFGLAGS